jgi:hypothetical protein
MIYCVGPEGNQATDAEDFIGAVKETGQNLFRAVRQYNQPTANRVPIDFVRVCLVSLTFLLTSPLSPLLSLSLSLSLSVSLSGIFTRTHIMWKARGKAVRYFR